jgi:hypothetical protein
MSKSNSKSFLKSIFTTFSLFSAILFFSFPTQTQAISTSSISTSLPNVVFTAAKKVVEPPFELGNHIYDADGNTVKISISDIGVSAPINFANSFDSQSSDWNCLKSYRQCPMRYLLRFGILHIFGTPQPGDIGNSILVGHSSCYAAERTEYCKVLAKLNYVTAGSKINISYSNGREQTFEVFDSYRVYLARAKTLGTQMDTAQKRINAKQRQIDTAKNAKTKALYEKQLIPLQKQFDTLSQRNEATNINKRNAKFPNERVITIETCWPLGTATDRWVVQAKLTEDKFPASN